MYFFKEHKDTCDTQLDKRNNEERLLLKYTFILTETLIRL